MKRLTFAIGIIFISLILAIVGAYLSWSKWSPNLVRYLLSSYGITLNTLDISRPHPAEITLSNLNANYNISGYRINLQAASLTLAYNLRTLMAGRLQQVQIAGLTLTISENTDNTVSSKSASTPLALLLPHQLFAHIPIEKVGITGITFASPLLRASQTLKGNLDFNGELLALTLQTPDATKLSLHASKNNSLSAELILDGSSVAVLESTVIQNTQLNKISSVLAGNLIVNLGSTVELLEKLGFSAPNGFMTGELMADWSLPLPETIDNSSLHHLQPSGKLSSSGTFRIPQIEENRSVIMQGAYQLNGHYQFSGQQLEWISNTFKISAKPYLPLAYAELNPSFKLDPVSVQIDLQPGVKISTDIDGSNIKADNLSGQLTVRQKESALDTQLKVKSADIKLQPKTEKIFTANAAITLNASINSINTADIVTKNLQLATSVNLTIDNTRVDAAIDKTTTLSAQKITHGELLLENFRINAITPFAAQWQQGKLTIPKAQLSIAKQQVRMPQQQLNFSQADINLHQFLFDTSGNNYPDMQLELAFKNLALLAQEITLAPTQLNTQLTLSNAQLSGNFTANTGDKLLTTTGDVQHNLQTGIGFLKANTETSVFTEQRVFLPKLIRPAPVPADFTGGQIFARSDLNWNQQGLTNANTQLRVNDVSGFFKTNLFKKANTTLEIKDAHNQMQINSESVHIAEVDTGVAINNIEFVLNLTPPVIRLSNIKAELFDGIASQKTILYNWSQPANQLVIDFQDIQLKKILSLENGISGIGSLDGSLPVIITAEGIRIAKGQVHNQPPGGVITYTAKAPLGNASMDAGLKLTLDTLENFHYDTLTMQVDSDEQGKLVMAATLQGRNPDLKQQRPIRFNLNITENIPALLQSLRLKQELSDDLEHRIESFFNPGKKEYAQ